MSEILRTILAFIVSALALTGLILIMKAIGTVIGRKLGVERSEDDEEDFLTVCLYIMIGLAALAFLAGLAYLLISFGRIVLLPIFGL